MNKRLLVAVLLAASALALVAHSLVWNFVTDDAFISFVYSRNLVEAGQLVFNLGERVEGYTNFLWTLVLAGLLKLGLLPEYTSRVLGTAFAILTLGLCARLVRAGRGDDAPSAWDAVPALFLCSSPGYACWSSGGLETQLFTCLFTAGATRYVVSLCAGQAPDAWTGLLFGLSALTRPEGVLFFALTGVHRLRTLVGRRAWPARGDWAAAAAFAGLVVPHLWWRHWYYGWWAPNTFYIKSSGGAGTWNQGGYYLLRMAETLHVWAVAPVAIAGLLCARGDTRLRAVAGYVLFVAAVFYVYVASVGGDFMGLYRFAMPVVPLLFSLGALALHGICARLGGRTPVALGAVGVLLAVHAAHAVPITQKARTIGADRGIDTPGFLRWYTADRAAIGKWFGERRRQDDYAAVGGAGAQVYYSRMPSLDCFGLSDAYIAHHVRAVSNRPGHQKYAPLEYQLSKRPTIITSNYYRCCSPQFAHAPYRPSAGEAAEWAQRGYRYVAAQIPGLSYPWYSFLLRNDRQLEGVVEGGGP
jgi:arabinofuranosyltransferase